MIVSAPSFSSRGETTERTFLPAIGADDARNAVRGKGGAMSGSVSITEHDGASTALVRVKPRASRARVVGVRAGAVEIALTAPPVDGAANEALVAFIAAACGVPKRDVTIVRGEKSREKLVRVAGVGADALRAALGGA
jgi:uncharacterized protein (TIGR00251 family)